MDPLAFRIPIAAGLPVTTTRVIEALAKEGFGVLCQIDVTSIFKTKLGTDFRPYLILGVCNPALAHRALTADPEAGLLLPCSITIEETGPETSEVRIANPDAIIAVGRFAEMGEVRQVASEARARLARVADQLAERVLLP